MKKIALFLIFMSATAFSQSFYLISTNDVTGSGSICNLYNLSDCSKTPVGLCTENYTAFSIATDQSGNLYTATDTKLFRQNAGEAVCTQIATFPQIDDNNNPLINALIVDRNGNVYATGNKRNSPQDSRLYKYSAENGLVEMGTFPPQLLSLGDLFFYENRLFVIARDFSFTTVFLIEVNIQNPSLSNTIATLDIAPYGAFSTYSNGVSKVYLTMRGFVSGKLYELDMNSFTTTLMDCPLEGLLNDAASYYELSEPLGTYDAHNSVGAVKVKNPAHDFIEFEDNTGTYFESASLFDCTGRAAASFSSGQKIMQITGLKPGLYFLHLKLANGKTSVQKIIVN